MTKLKKLYNEICMCSVFGGILEKPLFKALDRLFEGDSETARIKAYADFARSVYEGGGNLTDLVTRLILEDENVYVKSKAHERALDPTVEDAVSHELSVLERFAALTPNDFASELGCGYVSPFSSYVRSISSEYRERLKDISRHGYGIFASYPMFRLAENGELLPIISSDRTKLDGFVGYDEERRAVVDNTLAFIDGRPAANTLLCGDAGTGKSSTVKAVVNAFFDKGLRLVELRKDQLSSLPYVMGRISENPLKFIIFIDDLSFNQNDDNFSMLKAALEGSASAKADNAVIYATSNRRHIIKESFGDRDGDDVHRNDTMQETLSLSERFGLVVLFSKPNKSLYLDIVHELAERAELSVPLAELDIKAEAFALRRGSRSPRCAEQFIKSILCK